MPVIELRSEMKKMAEKVKKLVSQVGIDSTNTDYPDFTNNWRWVKYKDGTFKAEYKETITTGTLAATVAVSGIKTCTHEVNLPFAATTLDIPKWQILQATGAIFTTNTGTETLNSIKVIISRVIVSTSSYTATVGCTVTGTWKDLSGGY